jgi:hypothetical protein
MHTLQLAGKNLPSKSCGHLLKHQMAWKVANSSAGRKLHRCLAKLATSANLHQGYLRECQHGVVLQYQKDGKMPADQSETRGDEARFGWRS